MNLPERPQENFQELSSLQWHGFILLTRHGRIGFGPSCTEHFCESLAPLYKRTSNIQTNGFWCCAPLQPLLYHVAPSIAKAMGNWKRKKSDSNEWAALQQLAGVIDRKRNHSELFSFFKTWPPIVSLWEWTCMRVKLRFTNRRLLNHRHHTACLHSVCLTDLRILSAFSKW